MRRGISLVVLVITIVVLVIITGVIIVNAGSVMVKTDSALLQIDIAQLEALMNTYKIRNNGNIKFTTVQFDVSNLSTSELEQFAGENIVDDKIQLYVIDIEEIDAEDSNFGKQENGSNDRYLYSLTTGKVYYEQGISIDDTTYYYIKSGENLL